MLFHGGEEHNEKPIVTMILKESDNGSTIIEVNESGLKEEDPEVINKMMGQKEGWVYMLSCLKCYVVNMILII
ncbi:SRPBCC family protein [Metabacillus halosaccharovorans]|uniref:hypothetical protein n=1 Tax=Metabacillus halosaccharovorans TaxID=930124 RepID=UPI003736C3A2